MSLEALSNAVLSKREMDVLVEILTGATPPRAADRLSSLNRFKKTMIRILPASGAALADTILGTRPFKDAEAITRNALSTANAIEADAVEAEAGENHESGPEAELPAPEATAVAPEAPAHAHDVRDNEQ